MRPFKLSLMVLLAGMLSCTAQKKYELVLNIKDSAPTLAQLDSTVNVLKKRLQAYDKGSTFINRSPNQQNITLQTACGDLDFIGNVLVKKGRLVFYECYTIGDPETVAAIQNADKDMQQLLKENKPILPGVNNATFNGENPFLNMIVPTQVYEDKHAGKKQYTAYVANIMDSMIPLAKKCMPYLYAHLPEGSKVFFKKKDNIRVKASEVYITKPLSSAFDASNHLAAAKPEVAANNQPTVFLTFDRVGSKIWERMTARNVGKPLAIVLDNKVMSAPFVHSAIVGGNCEISGVFTFEEVQNMAKAFSGGSLPLTLSVSSIQLLKKN